MPVPSGDGEGGRCHPVARLAWGDRAQLLFSGISLGSILLLVALGWPSLTG